MKTIKKTLLVSLVPLIAPMTALAQTESQTESQRGTTGAQTETQPGTQPGQPGQPGTRPGQPGTQPGQPGTRPGTQQGTRPGAQTEGRESAHERKGDSASWRASNVMGKDVKNAESETIGEVEDLVVDMENGEIIAVIISTGGFLGIGESLSAVPVAVLRYDERAEGFKTKLTKDQLSRAPQFKANEWPDYSNATSSEALRSFRASLDGDTITRDSTTRNQDRTAQERHSVNPTDQGSSTKDVQITRDIRSDLMKTDLSSSAKNVNVITRDESVTLSGEVKSDDERKEVLKIAKKHCGDDKVTDNITVKSD